MSHVMLKLINCKQCPNCKTKSTIGAGCATDYICMLAPEEKKNYWDHGYRVIAGYVEWSREEPQDNEIPDWCPLRSKKEREELQKYKYTTGL